MTEDDARRMADLEASTVGFAACHTSSTFRTVLTPGRAGRGGCLGLAPGDRLRIAQAD